MEINYISPFQFGCLPFSFLISRDSNTMLNTNEKRRHSLSYYSFLFLFLVVLTACGNSWDRDWTCATAATQVILSLCLNVKFTNCSPLENAFIIRTRIYSHLYGLYQVLSIHSFTQSLHDISILYMRKII